MKKYPHTERRAIKRGGKVVDHRWRYDKWHTFDRTGLTRVRSNAIYANSKQASDALWERIRALEEVGGDERLLAAEVKTFAQVAKEWRTTIVPATCKKTTAGDYGRHLDSRVLPRFGEMPLDCITRNDIRTFLMGLIADGLSKSTVNQLKSVISGVMNAARDADIIDFNPALQLGRLWGKDQGKDLEDDEDSQVDPFSVEEMAKILPWFEAHRAHDYAYVAALVMTGMRSGEAIGLTWEDVDLEDLTIAVRRSWTVRGGYSTPKSGQRRTVMIGTILADILKRHRLAQRAEALAKGKKAPRLVFPNTVGKHRSVMNFRRTWFAALEKIGVPYRKPHNLRHTYATHRIMLGHNVAAVSKQLGHHSVQFTYDVYVHFIPTEKGREEIDALGSAFTEAQIVNSSPILPQ